ncbi:MULTISPECIES: chemotaxis protein CheA [unclassified Herbaspirillum]|uniref:chemotaxis protein CheA n=1 Tax=unclassified Herbaspirillum TaxID=2624150 RepID=UPI001151454B|nr:MULTISPECIES: chemotaxis protein CheA [unclassified Herbaspirillum]MBB5392420.1 two-component system chemotaxis sensor kinase CheA [Herbaspirillum sp. SJZ102]TQK06059.1 two-component system chemotaxis sensor kinase CheA [Herbaspirillum sp. SJZ130]TQK12463.1 two-component system chemotaxis sensor kinase CheA [Herbaspirillum sp. SJZ106]
MRKDSARDAVVQEARELLVAMEAALLQIEMEGPGKDTVNAIFRAAHTIKGSAGLFAFDSIVQFTHLVEHVLDKVRNDELPLNDQLMSLLLECGDYIGELVDAIERREEDQEPDLARRQALEAKLDALSRDAGPAPSQAPEAAAAPQPQPQPQPVAETAQASGPAFATDDALASNPYWHLSLQFSDDVMRDGLDPISFLHYLRTLGRIVAIMPVLEHMPDAAAMDPESCYIGFEICLASDSSKETLEGVFEFVREDSRIDILPPHSPLSDYAALLARLGEAEAGRLGRMWHQHGALNQDDWRGMAADAAHDAVAMPSLEEVPLPAAGPVDASLGGARSRGLEDRRAQEQKFIKIEVSKLDQLIDLVGELVIAGASARLVARRRKDSQFEEATQAIDALMEQIRDAALTLRMVQINEVFQRFPRVVRDFARDMNKEIELVMTGSETELDKSMIERIADPLMHIVRNAIDHGIEPADERIAAGKEPKATLRLNATHESGSVVVEVMDDGRGMDRDRILATAISRGLTTADADLTDAEIYRFVFEPGFSTARQITELSGRGVGMDVVKRNVDALHGEIAIDTVRGRGTIVRVRLPLTLAIISGFQVVVGNAVFVIPLDMVVECIDMPTQQHEHNIISVRDEPLPFVYLRELFELPARERGRKSLVIVQYGHQRAGLLVDGLLGECQAVIKPLGRLFGKVKGLSGSTILGDGRVALILDIPHLVQYTQYQEQCNPMAQAERGVASTQ